MIKGSLDPSYLFRRIIPFSSPEVHRGTRQMQKSNTISCVMLIDRPGHASTFAAEIGQKANRPLSFGTVLTVSNSFKFANLNMRV